MTPIDCETVSLTILRPCLGLIHKTGLDPDEIPGSAEPSPWKDSWMPTDSPRAQGEGMVLGTCLHGLEPGGCGPVQSQCQPCKKPLRRHLHTHLQERIELLLFLPVHISFLKEFEIRDEAPTWPDIPARNIPMWVPRRWARGSEMRRDRVGEAVQGIWVLLHSGHWEPVTIEQA